MSFFAEDCARASHLEMQSRNSEQESRRMENASVPATRHTIRPPPGRRRRARSLFGSSPVILLQCLFFAILISCCAGLPTVNLDAKSELVGSTRLASRGGAEGGLLDWTSASILQRRQSPLDQSSSTESSDDSSASASRAASTSTTEGPKTTKTADSSTTTAASKPSKTSGISTEPKSTSKVPLPKPFDAGFGQNYTTSSCPAFLRNLVADPEVIKCVPLSLLLQNSNSFFKAAKSLVTITQVLDASCNAGFASCSALMASYAQSLKQDSNCGEDFNNQNPLVVQALNGLVSYDPMYQAGCLRSDSGSYCFADAITNVDNPPDSYIYFLPLGLSLPGNSRPTCNSCLQKSMAIFATAAGNASQPASTVYISTAHQIQVGCGPTFVNSTVQTVDSAGGAATLATNGPTTVAFIAFLVALSAWLL